MDALTKSFRNPPDEAHAWMCTQEPWVRYRTQIDLLRLSPEDERVRESYRDMIRHPLIRSLIQEVQDWPGEVLKRHNDARHLLHKLVFLADLDIAFDAEGMYPVRDRILSHQSGEGPYQILGNIPMVFGGTGQDEFFWMLCDAPLLTYAVYKMGVRNDGVTRSVDHLLSLRKEFGWPCAADSVLGRKFKGPGRRTDPCPYANVLMLRLLSAIPELRNGPEARHGAGVLLDLWDHRKEKKYFLFGMGTDFGKLKAPLIWFDVLHVASVLVQFEFLRGDRRLEEMVRLIQGKSDEQGLFRAESVYRAWQDWDFGQKKVPSGWITYLAHFVSQKFEST
ncbi:MAG: hypothetical protein R2751_04990 [Bacteroidales bacterium]